MRHFFQRAGLGLFFFVFFADLLGEMRGVNAGALGVNLPQRRMILDAFVEKRLRDGRIVHFAVAVAAVADDIHDHVAAKCGTIFRGEFSNADDGVRIFGVHVENGNGLALGHVRGKARRMFLDRLRCKADEVIHDDVNRAANGVGPQVREVKRFRPDALARESRVAVDEQRKHFAALIRVVEDALARARHAFDDRVHRFEMARVCREPDADFRAGTTSIQAADDKGWAISVTPSGGWLPACIAGNTGISMSQRMQSFVLDEAENPFNVLAPGKRPRVTLTPTLALKNGKPFLCFSVQGGDTQDQNLLQFFLNVVEFGMTVQEACEAANITSYQMRSSFGEHKAEPGRMTLSDEVPSWVRRELTRMGYTLNFVKKNSGPITAIYFDQEHGTFWGGASNHGEDYGIAW